MHTHTLIKLKAGELAHTHTLIKIKAGELARIHIHTTMNVTCIYTQNNTQTTYPIS